MGLAVERCANSAVEQWLMNARDDRMLLFSFRNLQLIECNLESKLHDYIIKRPTE